MPWLLVQEVVRPCGGAGTCNRQVSAAQPVAALLTVPNGIARRQRPCPSTSLSCAKRGSSPALWRSYYPKRLIDFPNNATRSIAAAVSLIQLQQHLHESCDASCFRCTALSHPLQSQHQNLSGAVCLASPHRGRLGLAGRSCLTDRLDAQLEACCSCCTFAKWLVDYARLHAQVVS